MDKFGRIFKAQITTADGQSVEVQSPLTLEFQVVRHNLASANTASLVFFNLSETTRRKIYKDPFKLADRRPIQLRAGYEVKGPLGGTLSLLPIIFDGEVRQAFSVRQGPDVRTELECFDGGAAMSESFSSQTVGAGQTTAQVIRKLVGDMVGVNKVTVGNFYSTVSTRGTTLMGNPAELIKELTNGNFYIDGQEAFVLDKSEVVPGEINEISAATGLLESPRRADTMIECTMIFEPRIRVSQQIALISGVEKNYNGIYKVVGYAHRGTISGAKGGPCTTTVSLYAGSGPFIPVTG